MPESGTTSKQPCPECGEPMVWTAEALVEDAARGTSAGLIPDRSSIAAFRCENGHVSDACAVCSSRNTTRYANGPAPGQRMLTCRSCGNIATVS